VPFNLLKLQAHFDNVDSTSMQNALQLDLAPTLL
jgi:hypothetical protein